MLHFSSRLTRKFQLLFPPFPPKYRDFTNVTYTLSEIHPQSKAIFSSNNTSVMASMLPLLFTVEVLFESVAFQPQKIYKT